jgi:type IV pilus assembly protein PilF
MKATLFIPSILIIVSNFLSGCVLPPTSEEKQAAAEDNIKLGVAYLQTGDTPHAKEKLLLALEEAPDWAPAQDALGYFFESTGDKKIAEKYYQQALALSPHSGASLNNYAAFLCRDHRPMPAEKMFLQAATLPDYLNTANAYENAGLCALTIPDKNKATLYFKKALIQEPDREISMKELKKLDG